MFTVGAFAVHDAVVLAAPLGRGHIADLVPERAIVAGGDQADLWEAGCEPVARDAMQRLGSPVVGRLAVAIDGADPVREERSFFGALEVGRQQLDAIRERLGVVAPREGGGGRARRAGSLVGRGRRGQAGHERELELHGG